MKPGGTYTQLYIHIIFAVYERQSLIKEEWKEALYTYMTGVVRTRKHKLIAINGMPDHVHLLIGLHPEEGLTDLVRETKKATNKWIRMKGYSKNFYWQSGYGAFSVSRSSLDQVIAYIMNQEEHHATKTLSEEYVGFLKSYGIKYDERYIFSRC